jgi:MFS superfamily sulfate permease-like transporter
LENISLGATIITIVSVAILLIWKNNILKSNKILSLIPAPLLVVIMGILLNYLFLNFIPELALSNIPPQGDGHNGVLHVVSMPQLNGMDEIFEAIVFPDFSVLFTSDLTVVKGIFGTAFMIAIVARLETLLSVEASDRLDPLKRVTPTNKELIAQGVGNIVSGLVGGLPITQVIVRSSANVNAGGKTKKSSIVHGVLLMVSVVVLSSVLNLIPLSCLAGLLLVIGYKLASVSLFKEMIKQPFRQSLPFFFTIVIVLFTNLLYGITLGLIVAIFFILQDRRKNEPFEIAIRRVNDGKIRYRVLFTLHEEVQYLSSNIIKESLHDIPNDCEIIIDASDNRYIAPEIREAIKEFREDVAVKKNISVSYQDSQLGGREFDEKVIDNLVVYLVYNPSYFKQILIHIF